MLCIVERLWPLLAFINRVLGRNVLGHGLTMSWLFLNYIGHLHIVALTAFCVMSHCDLDIWRTNLKIHRVNARGTAYIQSIFRRNSLKNNRENGIQLI